MATIVIKPGLGVGSRVTRVDSGHPRKIEKKIFEILIFYMKKIKKQSM